MTSEFLLLLSNVYLSYFPGQSEEMVMNNIENNLKENRMDDDRKIPEWLFGAFENILKRQQTGRTKFNLDSKEYGDWLNFLANLTQIFPVLEHDSGENIFFEFSNEIGLYVCFESDEYEVKASVRN